MKSSLSTCYSKPIILAALLGLYLCTLTVVQAGGRDPLFPGPVRPGLDYRTELSHGYLMVYSGTDRFDDGGVPYNPHSSYSIYRADGILFKNVENHISLNDETPELVTLPIGSYTVEARSGSEGYLRVHVVVGAGLRTVVDLDGDRTDTQKRFARTKHSRHLANR